MVSEAAPAKPVSTGAALPRALAKLLSNLVQLFLTDVAGLDAPSQLFSLALSELANLSRLLRRGLKRCWDRQDLYIGLSLTYTQTHYKGHAQTDAPNRENSQQYDK